MKKIFWLLLLFPGLYSAQAQQLSASAHQDLYGLLHNPATAGSAKHGQIGASFRSQWSGMPGSPQTGLIFGSTYLQKNKIGLGGYLYNDVTGPTRRTGLQMAYAYHVALDEESGFSLGIETRLQQFSFDRAKLEQSLGAIDPTIMGNANRFKADAGFGVAYTSSKMQAGLSVSQLVQSRLNLYEGTGNTTEKAKLYRHYYGHGNYTFDVDGENRITPSLLFIYLPNAPLEMQAGARIEHRELFWYGLAWRMRQSWILSAGVRAGEKLRIGYSFDFYKTPISVYDKGSYGHEVLLRYDFLK